MVVDESGLIHGGYAFGLADYAAMIAVNHPNVVLGGSHVRFVEPVKVGDMMIAEAQLMNVDDGKLIIDVNITVNEKIVFIGEFICFAPEKHVLEDRKE
jgi:acyl-coenzyme A thioesterase PaaI-like protein